MRKYALVNNNIIVDIQNLEEEEVVQYTKDYNSVIDIEDITPQPLLRWVLNGNKFEVPSGNSDREQFEITLGEIKIDFGIKLAKIAIVRVGARNKILNKNGEQVTAILNSLLPIKLLMETGALGTARGVCSQLKNYYTEYSDIFDYVINEINSFERTNGL